MNCNQVAALILQFVEGARVGGQSEADNRIAAIIVAGKNRDPARCFRSAGDERDGEQEDCGGRSGFAHGCCLRFVGRFVKRTRRRAAS
ncbi:MAG: hypothetical protein DME23_25810 [Verrucomicrobia bacterium]|nr:MAG: hypothetical protein DME23_25810 [Verrucomicrobiota bacterium]